MSQPALVRRATLRQDTTVEKKESKNNKISNIKMNL